MTMSLLSGLDGRELAKENMRLGWERIVDMLTEDGDKQSTDFEQERAMSAARNKRMQRIMGEDNDGGAAGGMQYLQTSEQLNKKPDRANDSKPKLGMLTLENSADMESTESKDKTPRTKAGLKKSKSRRMIIKGLHSEKDELETQKYIEHWGADSKVSDLVRVFLDRAKASDKTVTPLLSGVAKRCEGMLYGLDFRIKSKASLTRKVLDKSKGGSCRRCPFACWTPATFSNASVDHVVVHSQATPTRSSRRLRPRTTRCATRFCSRPTDTLRESAKSRKPSLPRALGWSR